MKLTKELEAEIIQVMNSYWDSYLKGDIATWASFLPDDYRNIGTTEAEVWNSKKEIVAYTNAVKDQLNGIAELRDKQVQIFPIEPYIMVHELGNIYLETENGWTFYAKIRLSSLLQHTNDGWKILHQHGSYPDASAEKGDTFSFSVLSKENKELRDAVKRRTTELELKNRELEIEAALDKVRARALSMHSSNELIEVASVLREQMGLLGQPDLESCIVHLYNGAKESFSSWYAFTTAADKIITGFAEVSKQSNQWAREVIANYHSSKTEYTIVSSGDKIAEWYKILEQVAPATVEYDSNGKIIVPPVLYYHFSKFSGGALLMISNQQPSREACELKRRAAVVFELAYTRFLDLQKAETQAREAKIEAALEKVRSRSLAMHKSEELQEVVQTVFEKLSELHIDFYTAIITLFPAESNEIVWWLVNKENQQYSKIRIPYTNIGYLNGVFEARANGKDIFSKCFLFEEKNVLFHHLFENTDLKNVAEKQKKFLLETEFATISVALAKNTGIHITSYSRKSFSDQDHEVLKRFAKVFDQTYTRFLDLQKAEAQAREAEIELALERVRSRATAMYSSKELKDVATELRNQMSILGQADMEICAIHLYDESPDYFESIAAGPVLDPALKVIQVQVQVRLPRHGIKIIEEMMNQYHSGKKDYVLINQGEKGAEWFELLKEKVPGAYEFVVQNLKGKRLADLVYYWSVADFKGGALVMTTYAPPGEEARNILRRFSNVFGLAYQRFKDLKKAEEQARESQIEASLERVRARTMAMHNSNDVGETVAAMFDELVKLDVETSRCGVGIMQSDYRMELWTAKSEYGIVKLIKGTLDMKLHPLLTGVYESWIRKESHYAYHLKDEDLISYYKAINNLPDYPIQYDLTALPSQVFQNTFGFNEGVLYAFTADQLTDEGLQIFKRFAGVFGQTYRRYLDLVKAEAQAREAQIEAALERVRAKAMAMQSSEDVTSATETMFDELNKLGIENLRCGIANIHLNKTFDVFGVTNLPGNDRMSGFGFFGMDEHPVWQRWFDSWVNKDEVFIAHLTGQEKDEYFANINNHRNYLPQKIVDFPDNFFQAYYFEQGSVWSYSLEQHSESEKDIMKRFANGVSLTFRRYQDLKKAEAQAKEAKIEAALERVRGKAMAMHNSQDLAATIGAFYRELETFSITPRRCGVGLLNKGTRIAELSTMNTTDQGDTIEIIGTLKMQGHPVLDGVYNHWLLQQEYHPVLRGNEIKKYYQLIRPQIAFPDYPNDAVQHGYFFFFNEGGVYAWTEKELHEDELQIYRRFTTVLSLTYKRYTDLKQAETNAIEAIKQAALDRIRADIASMRTVADLDRITPLIWHELNTLGVPFIRCGVFIMDEAGQLIHTFLSTPDGKAIAAFHLPFHTSTHIDKVLQHWQQKEIYLDHWGEEAFMDVAQLLLKQGAIDSPNQYLQAIPKGGFYLHFLPFLQGMLYVGNSTELNHETIKLLQSVADAFSTAYARYEDFNRLEMAKKQMEKTLDDLKQAQQQLIQSEKMASLGELTAGIAHEIQNPLNFVNNFSDVSNELLEEMKTELSKGNIDDAIAISEDVKQNLEKILNHGKRADAIVKGMLQHSRSSSGQKELTDINALADEYLRLAYHGLRAKDKSFNAKFETGFDETLEKINIVPQEIGRVILNLINNAFYAVREKSKQNLQDYDPTVMVSTRKINNKIEIRIKDNANGIPDSIKGKIFQPFFSTKPTGQGTGLGLSLSYDIVKAHGGELKVETKEGEGSEFVIQLPAT